MASVIRGMGFVRISGSLCLIGKNPRLHVGADGRGRSGVELSITVYFGEEVKGRRRPGQSEKLD